MREAVLLIEDEIDLREAVAEFLRDEGFEVAEAADGEQALEWLQDSSSLPDAILLDLILPGMDGVTFRERQLAVAAWAEIPVILVTGHIPGDRLVASLGAASVLRKPFTPWALLSVLREVLAETTFMQSCSPPARS